MSCLRYRNSAVQIVLYNGLRLMPTAAHDSLASGELERHIFRREGLEEVRRIEGLARRKSTSGASSSVENPLDGFDDEWSGEGVDVASLRDRPADAVSFPDNNVDEEGLCRSTFF